MDLIKITDKFVTLNSDPYCDVTLWQGKTYLLNKAHAQGIAGLGLGEVIEGSDQLPYFTRSELKYHSHPLKVLFLFDGGLGDAISLALLLNALETRYNIHANVACKYEIWRDILKPLGFPGNHYQLPVQLDDIHSHDFIQPRADIFFKDKSNKWDICVIEELGKAYNVELTDHSIHYSVPEKIINETALPKTIGIRIGINFDSKGLVRNYPKELQPALISYLLGAGFEIFAFGINSPNLSGIEKDNLIYDYCGKTGIPELAALIAQMDFMLCMDSFMAHLSNILDIRTIVLLSTTRKGVFGRHKHILCLESRIECSPCGEVANACPKGVGSCDAFFHKSITPEIIAYSLVNECADHFNQLIQASVIENK